MLKNSSEVNALSNILNKEQKETGMLVLLEFTKRLIITTSPTIFLKEMEKREKPKEIQKEKFRETIISKIPKLKEEIISITPQIRETKPAFVSQTKYVLKAPETRLPPQFAYLRPIATPIELDLGKLNPLLADPGVEIIESNGADQQIIVRGKMGTKPTNIILTKEEINRIIQTFSERSRIPVEEGVTKIAFGKYILSAIISKEAGSRFIIKKIPPERNLMPMPGFRR